MPCLSRRYRAGRSRFSRFKLPGELRAAQVARAVVREQHFDFNRLAARVVALVRAREDDIVLLNLRQLRRVSLRLAPHGHQSVGLPVDIRELRDGVALNRGVAAYLLDRVLERGELVPLGRLGERVVVAEEHAELELVEASEGDRKSGGE